MPKKCRHTHSHPWTLGQGWCSTQISTNHLHRDGHRRCKLQIWCWVPDQLHSLKAVTSYRSPSRRAAFRVLHKCRLFKTSLVSQDALSTQEDILAKCVCARIVKDRKWKINVQFQMRKGCEQRTATSGFYFQQEQSFLSTSQPVFYALDFCSNSVSTKTCWPTPAITRAHTGVQLTRLSNWWRPKVHMYKAVIGLLAFFPVGTAQFPSLISHKIPTHRKGKVCQ